MKIKLFLFLFLSFNLSVSTFGQSTKKKANKLYEEGIKYWHARNFDKSIELMYKALKVDPEFAEAYQHLGRAYEIYGEVAKAEKCFLKVVELKPYDKKFGGVYYKVGYNYFEKGDYHNALKFLEKFLAASPRSEKFINIAKQRIANCKYGIEGMKNPIPFSPEALAPAVNAMEMQYFPVLSGDRETIIFTARVSAHPNHDENIWQSKKVNGKWQQATRIEEFTTMYNEGTCTISADGRTLIFTACADVRGGRQAGKRQIYGRCDLFISYKIGKRWSEPRNMGDVVNTKHWETQPSLSADGRTLYFASDKPGSIGGIDLWKTTRNTNGVWTKPVNLGNQVNTRRNEYSPFIHANGHSLFFSSDGYPSYGGQDLYKVELNSDGTWQRPENLGYPINNHRNQIGIFVTSDGKEGYYTNEQLNRRGQLFKSQIYKFEIPEKLKENLQSRYVKGTVYDAKTKKRLSAKVDLINLENKQMESSVHSDSQTGNYLIILNKGSEYALYVEKKGYLFQSLSFDYAEKDGKDVVVDVYLEPIDKEASIVLNNIFFESAKWDLLGKSKTELDKLVGFMQQNKTLKIEISGHTDNVGGASANQKLSESRAQAVVKYLVENGVETSRLKAKGYGETQPKFGNDTEENRAKNRRIEFRIL